MKGEMGGKTQPLPFIWVVGGGKVYREVGKGRVDTTALSCSGCRERGGRQNGTGKRGTENGYTTTPPCLV